MSILYLAHKMFHWLIQGPPNSKYIYQTLTYHFQSASGGKCCARMVSLLKTVKLPNAEFYWTDKQVTEINLSE